MDDLCVAAPNFGLQLDDVVDLIRQSARTLRRGHAHAGFDMHGEEVRTQRTARRAMGEHQTAQQTSKM